MFVSKAHEATATIAALNCSQAVIAFKMDGTILTANENFLAVTGYRLADIRGRSHAIFIAVNERQSTAYQRFWDGLKRGEFQAGEYRHIGKHGREVWLQATYNPILRPNGKPFKVIAFATDITARIGRESDDGASRLAARTFRSPVVKAMAFGTGVSRAAQRLREGEPAVPAQRKRKSRRRARRERAKQISAARQVAAKPKAS